MSQEPAVAVFIEISEDHQILPVSRCCLGVGKRLAEKWNGKLIAVLAGSEVQDAAEKLRYCGLDRIYILDHPLLKCYQPDLCLSAMVQVIEAVSPRAILMGHTLLSMDLVPRIAVRLDTGLVTDCVDLEFDSETLLVTKPVYSGNVMAVFSPETEPYLLTLRNGAFDSLEPLEAPGGDLIVLDVELDSSVTRTQCIERASEKEAATRLQTADVVVAGGRGMGGPQGFAQLEELAIILGGAVGGSRPPCDLGWVEPRAQVGQTGEIVAPGLYIAVGISGSTQHVAGMLRSKCIVAINKDPEANIFKIADYGVVGRHEDVLPAFKEALLGLLK